MAVDRDHVHAGCVGGGNAVGSVVDGEAAVRQDVGASGSREVQVWGRLAVRNIFSHDDGCELPPPPCWLTRDTRL